MIENPMVLQAEQPNTWQNHWFYNKTSPGNRRATDPGSAWMALGLETL